MINKILNFIYKFNFIEKMRLKYLDGIGIFIISVFLFIYFWRNSVNNYIGLILFVIGNIFWLKSVLDFGDSFGILPRANKLTKSGIYSRFAHPIYYFGLLVCLSVAIYTNNLIVYLVVDLLFILQVFRIYLEETVLIKKFGKEYIAYKGKVWF